MALHPPKEISSTLGLGLNTTKSLNKVSPTIWIGTEVWNELEEPWREGSTIIANPNYIWKTKWELGKPYIITRFHDEGGKLIATYCDVSRPVKQIEGGLSFIDLYLDVWVLPGQEPVILDQEELDDAVKAEYVAPEEAIEANRVATELLSNIKNNPAFLDF